SAVVPTFPVSPFPFPLSCRARRASRPDTTPPSRGGPIPTGVRRAPPLSSCLRRRDRQLRSRGCSRFPFPVPRLPDSLQVVEESWIADGHGGTFGEPNRRAGKGAEHRERHCEAVIPCRVDPPARRPGGAAHV